MKNLLDTQQITKEDALKLFEATDKMHAEIISGKVSSALQGRAAALLFYENSTRTAISFENAAKLLGMRVSNIAVAQSSVQKGENMYDTAKTLRAFHTDLIVMRHSMSGAAKLMSEYFDGSVINGGDGLHSHPTQALYDLYTMQKRFKNLEGRKAVIIGDIKHSRVARSNIDLMLKFGMKPYIFGPSTLLPQEAETLGAAVAKNMAGALDGADVVMALRIQKERQSGSMFPSISEYAKFYGLNTENIKLANKDAVVMHPGPVNWGAEMSAELIKSGRCVKDLQAEYGLSLRAALIKELLS